MKVHITSKAPLPPHDAIMEVPDNTRDFLKMIAGLGWGRFEVFVPGIRLGVTVGPDLVNLHFENDYD